MNIMEAFSVVLGIAVVVMAFAVTRPGWQSSVLRAGRFLWQCRQTLLFLSLCLLMPMAFWRFVTLVWEEFDDRLPFRSGTITWLILGGLTACLVMSWSAGGFRRHKVRAVIGLAICAATFWWTCARVQAFPHLKWLEMASVL
jgi:hypothetical protein